MACGISYEFIQFVRVLLQDQDRTEFTDERLKELITTAARLVIQEVDLDQTYEVSILRRSIDPEPFSVGDEAFVNLTALKAACIYDRSGLRLQAAKQNIKIMQEQTQIATGDVMGGYAKVIELGWCKSYEELRNSIENDIISSLLVSITTPIKTIDSFPEFGQSNYPGNRYCR